MRKTIVIVIVTLVSAAMASAQPRAIGGRFGTTSDDFVYQHSLSDKTFIELNAGFTDFWPHKDPTTSTYYLSGGVHVDFLHEWIWLTPDWTPKGEWNWFSGVGANIGWKWNDPHKIYSNGAQVATANAACFITGVIGNIGLEYNFWFPLSLAVDYRPTLGVALGTEAGEHYNSKGDITKMRFYQDGLYNFALSVRYKF